jgi:hypothetical protein
MTAKSHGNSVLLTAEIERIEADLELARDDVALLERLKSATDRVARLTGELEKVTTARSKALAAEAKANDERRFAAISNVSVTDGKTAAENVVRSTFTITYSRPAFDGRSTRVREHTCEGFGPLPPEVLDYIIEKRPDLIPAKIMALAPDSPRDAFRRYFVALRRGYVAA